jgi:hypothetical protein
MLWLWAALGLLLAGVALAFWIWRPLGRWGKEIQAERARESFRLQRERLEANFMSAAARTGKPRGLRWKDCDFENDIELARERETGRLVALISVTIQFEAIEGSDMEGLPAVGNLRNATAVFYFERGQWLTTGKAVFNLNPVEVIEHFKNQYEHLLAH